MIDGPIRKKLILISYYHTMTNFYIAYKNYSKLYCYRSSKRECMRLAYYSHYIAGVLFHSPLSIAIIIKSLIYLLSFFISSSPSLCAFLRTNTLKSQLVLGYNNFNEISHHIWIIKNGIFLSFLFGWLCWDNYLALRWKNFFVKNSFKDHQNQQFSFTCHSNDFC
jgi:hypothetical protein